MSEADRILEFIGKTGMGQFGIIKSLDELSSDGIFRKYLREAI